MNTPRFSAGCTAEEFTKFQQIIEKLIGLANTEILPRFLVGTRVFEKSNHTPVTEADKGAELVMRTWLDQNLPDHGIYGEEYGIKECPSKQLPRYRWILDPIDGTRAFITNAFHFGTLIAVEKDSGEGFKPLVGAISFPHVKTWVIGDGNQAILHAPDGSAYPVHAREQNDLSKATLLVTSHWTTEEQVGGPELQNLIDKVKLYRTWGDCFGYFAVATGGADIMIDPDLSYWDVAALVPVVEGAGAILTSCKKGNPLTDLSAVACTKGLYNEVMDVLNS